MQSDSPQLGKEGRSPVVSKRYVQWRQSAEGGSGVHSAGGTNRVVHRIDVGMENRHQSLL